MEGKFNLGHKQLMILLEREFHNGITSIKKDDL